MSVHGASRAPLLYLVMERRLRWALQAVKGVFDGFWLGALDDEQLDDLDAYYYDRAASYADETYNRSGLRRWERAFVDQYLRDGSRVVVIGAGGGRETLALLELGYDAVGFECNANLAGFGVDLLRRLGWPDRLHHTERDVWPPSVDAPDAVIVGWGSYMLIRGRDRRIAFLRDARARLPDGAPVLLSFFARSRGTVYLRALEITGRVIRRLLRRSPVEPGDALEPNYVHYFTRNEVGHELRAAGFELASFESADYGVAIGVASSPGKADRHVTR